MRALWPTAAAICSTLLASSFQANADEPRPSSQAQNPTTDVVHGELSQPETIPGKWVWEQPPMPPLEKVLRKATPNPFIYGFYQWADEYLAYRDSIKKVGWRSFRCGGPYDGSGDAGVCRGRHRGHVLRNHCSPEARRHPAGGRSFHPRITHRASQPSLPATVPRARSSGITLKSPTVLFAISKYGMSPILSI